MKKIFITGFVLLWASFAIAQNTEKVGKMTVTAFNNINEKGNKMVSAVVPTGAKLSEADKQLLLKIAAGGQRQLALSQAALDKAKDPQVRLLANSEVEEQTGVAAKVKEIAAAKGVTIPGGPDAATQSMVAKVQGMNDAQADAFYIDESGVKGHELLLSTMQQVNGSAKDAALKKLAAATLPVIRTHLTVARQVKPMLNNTRNQ